MANDALGTLRGFLDEVVQAAAGSSHTAPLLLEGGQLRPFEIARIFVAHATDRGALAAVAPGGTRDELLSGIAVGQIRSAVVLDGFELRDGKLYGAAEFVPDVAGADRILVVAGNALALATTGLTVTPQPVVDETRSLATVSADGVPAAEVLPFEAAPQLRDRAAVAVA